LLEAATDLFGKNGYHRTQVMDIVTRAHVSAGTFYRYFDDKQGIFFAIADRLSGHEVEEARKARQMILTAPTFEEACANMVRFLERHFERVTKRADLYQALHNSGVVDCRRDHAWAMKERAVAALTEQLRGSGPKDTEDLESLARMIMGVIGELRYAMIHTGKPTPAQAARLVTRFLQGGMTGFTTGAPRFPGLVSDEFREVLEREAKV
ncbi:MAG: TetR/AcrR family transcriptional regulator, partial [Myxococcales bacterium]|nr:TetR/AcrR family transcriptional regulator [Myxococcales bacterium]